MRVVNWLQRKYPDSYKEILNFLDVKELLNLKQDKRKIGRLNTDIIYCQKYPKGSLISFKRYKIHEDGIWNGEFSIHCIIRCQEGYTESGFHSISINPSEFNEVLS